MQPKIILLRENVAGLEKDRFVVAFKHQNQTPQITPKTTVAALITHKNIRLLSADGALLLLIYILRVRARGLGRRSLRATCTNTHHAQLLPANCSDADTRCRVCLLRFLQGVSIALLCKPCISYDRDVHLTVCLSHAGTE